MRSVAPDRRRLRNDARRMGSEDPQSGSDDLHRSSRPLRHNPNRRRGALAGADPQHRRRAGPRIRDTGQGPRNRARVEESQDAHGRHRGRRRQHRRTQRSADASVHHRGELGRRRRASNEIPLSRSAPRAAATQHDSASPHGARHTHVPRQGGFPRNRDPLSRGFDPRATSWCPAA